MVDILIAIFDKMSAENLKIIFWGITIFIGYVLFQVGTAVRRFSKNMDKEDRGIELSKENTQYSREVSDLKNDKAHFFGAIQSLNNYISNFNSLLYMHASNRGSSSQSTIEQSLEDLQQASSFTLLSINNEISGTSKSRVSYWIYNEESKSLESIMRSTNFTSNASRDTNRTLNIDLSIAGRAFRKKEVQFVSDLDSDPDWSAFSTNQKYKSILAVPIADFAVVTIDFSNVPSEVVIELCNLYIKSFEYQIITYVDEYVSYERYKENINNS